MNLHADVLTGLIYHSLRLKYLTLGCVFPQDSSHISYYNDFKKEKKVVCFLKAKMTSTLSTLESSHQSAICRRSAPLSTQTHFQASETLAPVS